MFSRFFCLLSVSVMALFIELNATVWSPPVTISGPLADNARVAVDPAGNAVAVWQAAVGSNILIQGATLPFGGAWSPPANISVLGANASNPQVTVDASGNAIAVWVIFNGVNTVIQASTLPFGGTIWTVPVTLSVAGENAIDPHVSAAPSGTAVAIWNRSNGVNTIIQSSSFIGGVWSVPINASLPGLNASEPRVAVDANGNAAAVWIHSNGTNNLVQLSNLAFATSAWTTPTNVSAAGENANNPQIAVDSAGDAGFVWSRFNGINNVIQAAVQPFFDGVSGITTISAFGEDATNPQIAVNPSGGGVVVWQLFNGTNSVIQASTILAANLTTQKSVWTAPITISTAGENATDPQVAVDAHGDAIAVWSQSNGTNTIIEGASLPFGATWSAPQAISLPGENGVRPFVASDAAGDAVAVWEESSGTGFVVQASSNPQFFRPAGPQNVKGFVIKDHFLTQTDIVHQLQFTASTDTRVVSYNIFRNGKLIGNVLATQSPLFFNDHDRTKKRDTYTITSVLSTGVQSNPVTITVP